MDTKSNANGVMSSSVVSTDKRHPTSWAGAPLKGTWQDQCKHLSPARPKGQSSSIRDLAKQDDIARGVLPGSSSPLSRSDGRAATPPTRPFAASVSPRSPPLGSHPPLSPADSPLADSAIRRVIHLESVVSTLQTEYATLKVQHDQLRQSQLQKSPPPPAAAPPKEEDDGRQKEIERLRHGNQEAQQTIQNLRDELLAASTKSAAQLQELQSAIRQREEDRTDQSKLNEVVEQRNQAESVVETMVASNAQLEQQVVSKNEEIQSLQRTAAQTHQLQADLRRKEEEIALLQAARQADKERFEENLQQKQASTDDKEEVERLREELQKNTSEVQTLQQAGADQAKEVTDLKDEVERLTRELQESKKLASETVKENDEAETAIQKDANTDELHNLKEALREASEQRDQAERVVDSLLPQNESLEQEVNTLKDSLFIAEEQREQAERCVEQYHQEVVKNEELASQLEEITATRDQAERLAEQLFDKLLTFEETSA
eukprot:TRINITY_DN7595_c0_g1_i2.p1 TRINITY_DN7595_c0_g1~~TRINITY_DN7595_c0_g1_i2.p1  ORF type:complete len:491 (+),score=131.94 TRINITY_DN7595_c0_g1_i2:51-1523(+)